MINLEVKRSQYNMKILVTTHSNMKDRIDAIQSSQKIKGYNAIWKKMEKIQSKKNTVQYERGWRGHSSIGKMMKGHNPT